MMTAKIKTARMNLAAANVIGGRSSSPTLIKTQVVPQIKHKTSQIIIFICEIKFMICCFVELQI